MKKFKLNVLASENLSKIEMKQLQGGNSCSCGCQGPSSTADNCNANYDSNLTSTVDDEQCRKWDSYS